MLSEPRGLKQLSFDSVLGSFEAFNLHKLLASVCVAHQKVADVIADLGVIHSQRESNLTFPTLNAVIAVGVHQKVQLTGEVRFALRMVEDAAVFRFLIEVLAQIRLVSLIRRPSSCDT